MSESKAAMGSGIVYPRPLDMTARVEVTERHYIASAPAPTDKHPHRIVVVRVRAFIDVLIGAPWRIEVADVDRKKVMEALPNTFHSEQVPDDLDVDRVAMEMASRLCHAVWINDRCQEMGKAIWHDWIRLDRRSDHGSEATP